MFLDGSGHEGLVDLLQNQVTFLGLAYRVECVASRFVVGQSFVVVEPLSVPTVLSVSPHGSLLVNLLLL